MLMGCCNVHSMIHLVDDYKKHGNLEHVSAFCFEDYLGKHVKGSVRANYRAYMQIAQHLLTLNEKNCESKDENVINMQNNVQRQEYNGIRSKPSYSKDNCIQLSDKKIAYVTEILMQEGKLYVKCKIFLDVSELFFSPIPSSKVGIYKISSNTWIEKTIKVKKIEKKVVILPMQDGNLVAVAFLHKFNS